MWCKQLSKNLNKSNVIACSRIETVETLLFFNKSYCKWSEKKSNFIKFLNE